MFQNPMGAIKLGQARGVAMCTLAINNLEVSEYSAKQIKQAVVGTEELLNLRSSTWFSLC